MKTKVITSLKQLQHNKKSKCKNANLRTTLALDIIINIKKHKNTVIEIIH
ncbi:hypothetical protein [Neobacillus drentensis]